MAGSLLPNGFTPRLPAMTSATRIIQTLGGHGIVRKRAASYGAVVDRVRSGLPYAALEAVATRYGMSQEAVVRVLRLPLRTLGRRKKDGRLSPDESDRLLRLARIGATAEEVLESRDKAVAWLHRPNRALGGRRPLEMLDTDLGAHEVEQL